MTETTVAFHELDLPVKSPTRRKKTRRRARRKPAAVTAKMPDELAGMTVNDCPLECTAMCCVISGHGYCGHPRKGGLRGSDMTDPAAQDRAQRARKALARAAAEKRS